MAVLDTILTLIIVFTALVLFHELGHFLFAKLFKMRVEEFALGFGKPKFRVGYDGQTEYTIRPLPIGGFVRIAGMEIEDAAERRLTELPLGRQTEKHVEAGGETTNLSTLRQETEEVAGASPDGFNSRPIYQRFLVILAGPVFSLLLGWLAYCSIGAIMGIPSGPPTNRIAALVEGAPAHKAGLRAGETITAIGGSPISNGEEMIARISEAPGKPLVFTIRGAGGGGTRDVTVTPAAMDDGDKKVGRIGVVPASSDRKRVSVGESFSIGTKLTAAFYQQLASIFAQNKVSENIGGPIGIVKVTKEAVQTGGSARVELLAQLSLSLAFFNLLPIPILDGGHLLLMIIEAVRRRKLTAVQMERVFTAGAVLLLGLFVFVMFNDITRLFKG